MKNASVSRLAAVRFEHTDDIDAVLESTVRAMQARGLRVCGFVQRETEDPASCCNITHLEDVATGTWHRISQPLGSGSRGCRLDPQALAEVSGPLLAELETRPDFLLLNRFGKGESEGQGFRAVIEKAFELRIPVLTAVREAYAEAWATFTESSAHLLPPDTEAVLDWADAAVAATQADRTAA